MAGPPQRPAAACVGLQLCTAHLYDLAGGRAQIRCGHGMGRPKASGEEGNWLPLLEGPPSAHAAGTAAASRPDGYFLMQQMMSPVTADALPDFSCWLCTGVGQRTDCRLHRTHGCHKLKLRRPLQRMPFGKTPGWLLLMPEAARRAGHIGQGMARSTRSALSAEHRQFQIPPPPWPLSGSAAAMRPTGTRRSLSFKAVRCR